MIGESPQDLSRARSRTGPCAPAAKADRTLATENAEPTLAKDATENSDRALPAEPIERIDPAEPIDKMDPVEPIDRIEPDEPIDSSEPFWSPHGRTAPDRAGSRQAGRIRRLSHGGGGRIVGGRL